MQFYRGTHKHYCGVDLHARNMYLCIVNPEGNIVLHRRIGNNAEFLWKVLFPYREDLVVCCESTYNYYWLYDTCVRNNISFVLAHAQELKAVHGAKTKNDRIDSERIAMLLRGGVIPKAYPYPAANRPIRDLMRRRSYFVCHRAAILGHIKIVNGQYNLPPIPVDTRIRCHHMEVLDHFAFDEQIAASIHADIAIIESYDTVISDLEAKIRQSTRSAYPQEKQILQSIRGVGDIITSTILYETNTIKRFESVQKFASYARLVKCSHTSNSKNYGFGNPKKGNPHLKWIFSEAVHHMVRLNPDVAHRLKRLEKKHGKSGARARMAHQIGRTVYFMLKRMQPFDEKLFLKN